MRFGSIASSTIYGATPPDLKEIFKMASVLE
jgi:hypothetical protein